MARGTPAGPGAGGTLPSAHRGQGGERVLVAVGQFQDGLVAFGQPVRGVLGEFQGPVGGSGAVVDPGDYDQRYYDDFLKEMGRLVKISVDKLATA